MEEDKLNKAIDLLKSEIEIYDKYYCLATSQALKIVLKELDRLQKENEELKIDNNNQWEERCRLSFELDDSIAKSVIQDKIEEIINNSTFGCVGCEWNDIEVVQLLENILRGNN